MKEERVCWTHIDVDLNEKRKQRIDDCHDRECNEKNSVKLHRAVKPNVRGTQRTIEIAKLQS